MPMVVAKLGQLTAPGRRQVWFRGTWHEGDVVDAGATLLADSIVLLESEVPPWLVAAPVRAQAWPKDLLPYEELRRLVTLERREVPLAAPAKSLASYGTWYRDSRGMPCEIGTGGRGSGFAFLVNYSGWRIADLGDGVYTAFRVESTSGTVVILPSSLKSAPAGTAPDASDGHHLPMPYSALSPPSPPPVPSYSAPMRDADTVPFQSSWISLVPAVPEPRRPEPVSKRLRFVDIEFGHEVVTIPSEGRDLIERRPWAREVLNELRSDFDAEHPRGIRVHGVRHPDGRFDVEVDGLDVLEPHFRRLHWRAELHRSARTRQWFHVSDIGADDEDHDDVDDKLLKFGSRRVAFKRLYSVRYTGEPVRVLPGHGFVIPIAASDGGKLWYAWETVDGSFATYLFRPQDEESIAKMLDWTRQAGARRMELLGSPELRAQFGFVGRVRHKVKEDGTDTWWTGLAKQIGFDG